jgi:hypothetical protein
MSASKPSTRKAKGRNFQVEVAEEIRRWFKLEERDVVSAPASTNGEDIILSEAAKKLFPFSIECKRSENIAIWKALEQCNGNCAEELIPVLAFKRNHSKTYCCLEFNDFLSIVYAVNLYKRVAVKATEEQNALNG